MSYNINESPKHTHAKKWILVIIVLVLCGICVSGAIYMLFHSKTLAKSTTTVAAPSVLKVHNEPAKTLSSHMLVVGELFWGRGIEYYAKRSALGYANPFSSLDTAQRATYDAWIADMECPITTKDIPYQTQVDSLLFNCRPEYLPEAKKWFNAFTLANNHTDNNGGQWGIEQTRLNLDAQQIQYTGDYNMQHIDNICDVIAMPAQVKSENSQTQHVTMPVALCGYDYVGSVTPKQAQFDVIKQYSEYVPVIAMPHMGVEYRPTAEDAKVTVYRKLIDSGADIVIGAHPHVIQNSETYKGRLIVYSTGNFMFDQQSLGRDTILDFGVDLTLVVHDTEAIATYTGQTGCGQAHDTCVHQLAQTRFKRPSFDVTYNIVCFEQSSTKPKLASDADCNDIKQRATWQTATANLEKTW